MIIRTQRDVPCGIAHLSRIVVCAVALTTLCMSRAASVVASDVPTPHRAALPAGAAPLMAHLVEEMDYSMAHLASPDGMKPYYISYAVYDETTGIVSATLGAIAQSQRSRERNLNIDLRVGDYALDNTHQIRGAGPSFSSGSGNVPLSLSDDREAVMHEVWYYTDRVFKDAASRLEKIRTNLAVKVEEEDRSEDFTREEAHQYVEPPAAITADLDHWTGVVRRVSEIGRDYPLIYNSSVTLGTYAGTRTFVSTEGARLQTAQARYRVTLSAATKADDGMDLALTDDFNAFSPSGLPGEGQLAEAFRRLIDRVMALRAAPIAEPYIGPAILRNRASAVFFHEIFGHRIEGHRQKDVTEGQTFTKKINEQVLPPFLSVYDDPTLAVDAGVELRGYYLFDDEGVRALNTALVEDGVLRTFLMSRRPIEGFPKSNGHGRRAPGYAAVSRQANLVVRSKQQVPFDELRRLMLEECRKQEKPYGLLFEDISGGFTMTSRRGPQSFKVLPLVVFRVFADGRPDELIRGVDVVGTPLTAFAKITHTGDDPGVFNGSCGAESGWVPVSAVSPSILVSTLETEKRVRDQSRPPLLESPLATHKDSPAAGSETTR